MDPQPSALFDMASLTGAMGTSAVTFAAAAVVTAALAVIGVCEECLALWRRARQPRVDIEEGAARAAARGI